MVLGCRTYQQGKIMILTTGKPIRRNAPKSVYRLSITNMHGDADAETVNNYHFEAKEIDKPHTNGLNLFEIIEVLNFYDGLDHNSQCDFCYSSSRRRKIMLAGGFKDKVIDNITEYMDSDCTNDGNTLAMFDGWEVTWFDANGVEHEVNVKF